MDKPDIEYYGIYADKLVEVSDYLYHEITAMLDKLGDNPETALAEHVKCRIKDPASLDRKLAAGGFPSGARSGLSNLSDIVGMRVVTHFVGDIYTILEDIGNHPGWRVVKVKDYIASPKPNGYRSLHVILSVPFGAGGIDEVMVEVQLRTIAMDCWASLEHQLKYKKDIGDTTLITAELKRCADEMASTDLSMQTIRDLIAARRGELL